MERGEIWKVDLDPVAGHEQRGNRPVIIVSTKPFNDTTDTPIVLPITAGGAFARNRGFAIPLEGTGTRTVGVVRCDQPRAIDLIARNGSKLETAPIEFVDEILARLLAILE